MANERILVYGFPGTGKSYQFLKIADFARGSGAKCYVLDTDDAYGRMLEAEFAHLAPENGGNVVVFPVFQWGQWESAFDEVCRLVKPGDWVCVDRADVAWEAVQEYYVEQVFGQKMGDFFLKARQEIEETLKKNPKAKQSPILEGDRDWGVINRLYKQQWFRIVSPSFPAHLYVAVAASPIERRDEQVIHDTYGWIGAKPSGQKHLPYQVHTVFYFSRSDDGWFADTVKDRGRAPLEHKRLVSLPHQYLLKFCKQERPSQV